MIATSGFLTALECIKFIFYWGSAPNPTGGAYSTPSVPLAGLKGPTSEGEGRESRKGRGEEWKEKDWPLFAHIPGSTPEVLYK